MAAAELRHSSALRTSGFRELLLYTVQYLLIDLGMVEDSCLVNP